jgi:hypothetical protein
MPSRTNRLRFELHPEPDLVEAVDRFRAQTPGLPSRAEAGRMLIEEALKARELLKPEKSKRASGERR